MRIDCYFHIPQKSYGHYPTGLNISGFTPIVLYVLFCIFCFHRASWHYSATLIEVFPCFFFSCKANARV
jgi:hypothetical protein